MANMTKRRARSPDEPSLPEIFAEPIIRAVMARDGITKIEMECLLADVRRKLALCPSKAQTAG
jgi:hypothetical protein